MSHINPSFDNENEPHFDDTSLNDAMDETMFLVQHLEPKVRDLNRHYRELLGAHPDSSDGTWVYLSKTIDGSYCFCFHPISVDRVIVHSAHIGTNADILEEHTNDLGPTSDEYIDLGPQILGEVAALSYVPSTHVHVERRS